MFAILSTCRGGGYTYCRTNPPHPKANAKGLYPLHRVLAENRLGRLLHPGEVVHHADGNKQNDDPENLAVMQSAEHSRYHRNAVAPPMVAVDCPCGVRFELRRHQFQVRAQRNDGGRVYCSRSCARRWSDATL